MFSPHELIEKLAALVPPPRMHLIRMRMIAARTDPDSIRTYLTGVGLPADAPVISPARPPPQQELEFAA